MRLIAWILGAAIIVVATVFGVTNRAPVTIDLWPLPYQVAPPFFLVILLAVMAGFLCGGIAAWWAGRRWRRRARRAERDAETLRREVGALQREVPTPATAVEIAAGRGSVPSVPLPPGSAAS